MLYKIALNGFMIKTNGKGTFNENLFCNTPLGVFNKELLQR